jgi:precorrin-4/cobalt-precorrin-4 C11-methyltransferase
MQHGRLVRRAIVVVLAVAAIVVVCQTAIFGAPNESARPRGRVYLVGMGPGDPELVTFKAARVLKEADAVYCFDYLKDEVARYVPADKLRVASSLLMGRSRPQNAQELPPQLRERARRAEAETATFAPRIRAMVAAGKTVAFADAGDPTIYCPWTWITDEFGDLDPMVVPGLSSFNAANAALKQSMTKNGGSILLSPGDNLGSPDAHGRLTTMLVLFTHKTKFQELLQRLQSRYPGDTPMAIVCEASYDRQRVVFATLATIRDKVGDGDLPHLYLVYAGDGLAPPIHGHETVKGRAAVSRQP